MGICTFCYMWNWCGVVVFQRSMLNWRKVHLPVVYVHSSICETYLVWWFSRDLCSIEGEYICLWYMCILLYVKLIWCSGFPEIYAQLKGDTSAFGICAFFHMWNLFGVVVFQRSMFNWRRSGYVCLWYMCILLHVKPIWCSGFPEIYALLGGTLALGIYAFHYMWNLFSVVVFQRSMLNWRGIHLPLVYVHSTICETYLV